MFYVFKYFSLVNDLIDLYVFMKAISSFSVEIKFFNIFT